MKELYLNKLQVSNFRNLNNTIINFKPSINCIFGKNGNGKTNILEAIYFLIHHKSFRKNASFPQILSMDSGEAQILFLSLFNEDLRYSGKIDNLSQAWYQNNTLTKKKIETAALFVNPFDSYNFHQQASFRRNWFEQYIATVNPLFKKQLGNYQKALRFRNALFTRVSKYDNQFFAIDKQIAQYSLEILKFKTEFLVKITPYIEENFKQIFYEEHRLKIELSSDFLDLNEKEILATLENNFLRDAAIGHTQRGIHRDDYMFQMDGLNSYQYCSLGQQKMGFLSLVFAFIDIFKYEHGVYPLVLIDDVSGELDSLRWKNLIEYLQAKKFQVFITTANEAFEKQLESIVGANKIYVENGNISS